MITKTMRLSRLLVKYSDAEKFSEDDWYDTLEIVKSVSIWILENTKVTVSTPNTSEISPAPKKHKKREN